MAFDIVVRDRISSSIRTKLDGITKTSTRSTESVRRLKNELNNLNNRTRLDKVGGLFARLQGQIARTNRELSRLSASFARVGNASRRLLSGALLLQATGPLFETLDTFANLQNRLRGVSGVFDINGIKDAAKSQERLNELTRQMFDIANRARVPVGSLAKTYRRLDGALKEMGESQQKSLELTETVSKLLTLAGSTAQESSSALLQLGQAFNKAKLDGDEFRSVAELMPRAIRAITEVLKKDLGANFTNVFDSAEKGLITSSVLLRAFGDIQKEVTQEFKDMPRTVGQAFTQLTNEITKAFGTSGTATSVISRIIAAIDWLKNNLGTVTNLLKAFVAVMAVQIIGSFAANLGSVAGWINILATAVSAAIGWMTFFADKIKVTEDGLITLQDVINTVFQLLRKWATTGGGILGSIFGVEGAQFTFEVIKALFNNILTGINHVVSAIRALWNTWMSLDFEQTGILLIEAFQAAFLVIKDGLLEVFRFLVNIIRKVGDAFLKWAYRKAAELNRIFKAAFENIPLIGSDIATALDESFLNLEKLILLTQDKEILGDLGINEMIDGWKTNFEEAVPLFMEVFRLADERSGQSAGLLQQNYRDSFNQIETGFRLMMDQFLNITRQNVNDRIKEEKRYLNSMRSNVDALRRGTLDTSGDSVLFFGRGAEQRTRVQQQRLGSGRSRPQDSGSGVLFFGRGAEQRRQRSRQRLPRQWDRNKFQALDNFSDRVDREVQVVESLERSTQNVNRIRSGFQGVNDSVEQLSRQSRDLTFDQPRRSINTYGDVGTQRLKELSRVNFDVASHIEMKQTEAWRNARSEVEAFANYAMNVLLTLAKIREMQQPRTDAFGRPADTRFLKAPNGAHIPIEINRRTRDGMLPPMQRTHFIRAHGSFSSGGYTGNISRNRIAGVVHGGEYVMPAEATKRYRPLLEAMRSGSTVGTSSGSNAGTTLKVNIENYGSSTHQVQQISANEVRIIAREAVESGATNVIARELSQPNSLISKSINQNLRSQRRR